MVQCYQDFIVSFVVAEAIIGHHDRLVWGTEIIVTHIQSGASVFVQNRASRALETHIGEAMV